MNTQESGFMDEISKSEKFRRAIQYETLIEGFLNRADCHMIHRGITRENLSAELGIDPATLDGIFNRTSSLSVKMMSDMAYVLGLELTLTITLKD